ncbi:MAG TPA: type II toxin-antitoxin system HicB family antitoxin [Candidatus Acidoferrales bacterium]|nr:type II toxin-antitoxin system HicB family antitoxin [Candidatus Acidoferrales bacterium]
MAESALRYRIILEPEDEGGYNVVVPAFPNAHTCGDTREEAIFNAREVIELMLEHFVANGRDIPPSDAEDAPIVMIDVQPPAA